MRARLLRLVVASLVLVALAYAGVFAGGGTARLAPWLMALGANGAILSLMALGAVRGDALPRALAITFAGLWVVCAGAFVAALALPPAEGAGGALLLGLPVRTALVIYGVGVLPIFVLPFAYALTFESSTLSDEDVARVREAGARVAAEAAARHAAAGAAPAREVA